jgi:hypothetical protein
VALTRTSESYSFGVFSARTKPAHYPLSWYQVTSQSYAQSQSTEIMIERNQKRFGQVHGRPFTDSPLQYWVVYHGTSKSADAVLRGGLPPDQLAQCTEGVQARLEALQQEIVPANSADTYITAANLWSGFKAWREKQRPRPRPLPVNISDILHSPPSNASQSMMTLVASVIESLVYSPIWFTAVYC